MTTTTGPAIKRGFADITEGQVHYRTAKPEKDSNAVPLVMFHGSPTSSLTFAPLVQSFARTRTVFAPDTVGQGDSCAPKSMTEEMPYFANAALRAIDTMGIEKFDLYGTHTGAAIAVETAIAAPDRINKLILDGVKAGKQEWSGDYADHLDRSHLIDTDGTQFTATWNTLRNVMLFWPPDRHEPEYLRPCGLPPAEKLHDMVIDALKSIRTNHVPYRAAILYNADERLPLVSVPTLLTCAGWDMLWDDMEPAAALIPGSVVKPHPSNNPESHATAEEVKGLADLLSAWLDG